MLTPSTKVAAQYIFLPLRASFLKRLMSYVAKSLTVYNKNGEFSCLFLSFNTQHKARLVTRAPTLCAPFLTPLPPSRACISRSLQRVDESDVCSQMVAVVTLSSRWGWVLPTLQTDWRLAVVNSHMVGGPCHLSSLTSCVNGEGHGT